MLALRDNEARVKSPRTYFSEGLVSAAGCPGLGGVDFSKRRIAVTLFVLRNCCKPLICRWGNQWRFAAKSLRDFNSTRS
jgi:hypothetical protein